MTHCESDTREATIRAYLPLVRTIAKRVATTMPAADIGDLVGDGSIGLIRAVDCFNPARGIPLQHYARKMILGAMLNGMRKMDPISERARRTIRTADAARYAAAQERGTLPSFSQMEPTTRGLDKALHAAHRSQPLSLDGRLAHDETGLLDRTSDPAEIALARMTGHEMRQAIALLPERHRRVVEMHYYNAMSLQAIGAKLRVSPQRASQLHLAALKRLRYRMGVLAG